MNAIEALPGEIRGVMLPVTGGRVLVPSTTMAEVITFAVPVPLADAPDWLLGRVGWRGWRLPVVSFAVLTGMTLREPTENARVAVLKALGGHPQLPYFGVLTQGFPRLTLIFRDTLMADAGSEALPAGVSAQARVQDERAWIPDLATIEAGIARTLASAA